MTKKKKITKKAPENTVKKENEGEKEAKKKRLEDFLENVKSKDELINAPKTLLKKEEWGLLTVMNLLLAGLFPVYFVNILLISFFTEIGHLWTTHITEVERQRLVDFEKEFRKGYKHEENKKWKEAVDIYRGLIPKYKDNPKISKIAADRISWIEKKYMKKGR